MTIYQLYSRVKHCLTAKHFRGHGIHSPFLYDFIRTVVIANKKEELVLRVENRYWPNRTQFISSIEHIDTFSYVVILGQPFRSRSQYKKWIEWRSRHSCASIHLKNHIVIFLDKKLQNQHFTVRS